MSANNLKGAVNQRSRDMNPRDSHFNPTAAGGKGHSNTAKTHAKKAAESSKQIRGAVEGKKTKN
jgi:hypothetical protein